jgi:integrase
MGRQTHRLTVVEVEAFTKPGWYADGDGLYLKVNETGARSWVFRFKRGPKVFNLGLGAYGKAKPGVSLAEARKKAMEHRAQIGRGEKPEEIKAAGANAAKQAEATAKPIVTFDLAVEQFLDGREGGWKNAKHRQQWRNTLKTYASPVIGSKDVAAVDTADVLAILTPIWRSKAETASRVRGRIEAVLGFAHAKKRSNGEAPAFWLNPAAWRGHLDLILLARDKKRTVRHHPAMPFAEVPEFIAELRANSAISSKALQFTILTAVRTSEAIEATWPEVDLDARLWIIPKERMNASVEFRVPLTDDAVALLRSLPRMEGSPYLFPGMRECRPLSNMAMLELLRGMRLGLTVHGFRSSFRDWAGDATHFPRDTVEMCLAHAVEDQVEAAYRRSDMIEKRRKVMEAWAKFCSRSRQKADVIPFQNVPTNVSS